MSKFKIPPSTKTQDDAVQNFTRGGGVNLRHFSGTKATEIIESVNLILVKKKTAQKDILHDKERMGKLVKLLREAWPSSKEEDDSDPAVLTKLGKAMQRMNGGKFSDEDCNTLIESIWFLYMALVPPGEADRYVFDKQGGDKLAAQVVGELYKNRHLLEKINDESKNKTIQTSAESSNGVLRELAENLGVTL